MDKYNRGHIGFLLALLARGYFNDERRLQGLAAQWGLDAETNVFLLLAKFFAWEELLSRQELGSLAEVGFDPALVTLRTLTGLGLTAVGPLVGICDRLRDRGKIRPEVVEVLKHVIGNHRDDRVAQAIEAVLSSSS